MKAVVPAATSLASSSGPPAASVHAKTQERVFTDEYELIETMNPLLPHGSDVRDVISHIESPDGFLYLLYLSSEEAGSLGWRE